MERIFVRPSIVSQSQRVNAANVHYGRRLLFSIEGLSLIQHHYMSSDLHANFRVAVSAESPESSRSID